MLAFSLILQGCSLLKTPEQSKTTDTVSAIAETASAKKELPAKPFSEDTLFNLLVGELAVYERDLATAVDNYRREALYTHDTAITARAAKLSRYLRDEVAAIEMAELWYQLAPESATAANNLADLYARSSRPLQALDVLEAQLTNSQQPKFGILRNSKFQSKEILNTVVQRLGQLTEKPDHNNFSLIFTHTLLLQKNGQTEAALKQLRKLERFESDPIQLALIESQLLSELDRHKEAVQVLSKARKKFPDEMRLAIAHARKLTKINLPRAEQELAILLLESPENNELLMAHALVAAENKHLKTAEKSLKKLLTLQKEVSFAHYNLGLIAQQREDLDKALAHYEKVKQGQHYLLAIEKIVQLLENRKQITEAREFLASLRTKTPMLAPTAWSYEARLLSDNNRGEEALEILSSAILQFPQQHQLRMQRSFLADNLGRIDLAEHDLRYILDREPNNPNALNALGYILADRTNRYTEARDLIEKALTLMPESASIIDSLGWVMYKQGEIESAVQQLEKAFALMPDDEIAAHLVEIYWQNNQASAAHKIYKKLRKTTQQHPKLNATLKRFNISF